MANISNYDAKIYFWGMVFFASVSFIALPLTAFIYMDNLVLNAKVEKKLQQLETSNKERKKNERIDSKVDGQTTNDSGRD
jgi:hypothetical protein